MQLYKTITWVFMTVKVRLNHSENMLTSPVTDHSSVTIIVIDKFLNILRKVPHFVILVNQAWKPEIVRK